MKCFKVNSNSGYAYHCVETAEVRFSLNRGRCGSVRLEYLTLPVDLQHTERTDHPKVSQLLRWQTMKKSSQVDRIYGLPRICSLLDLIGLDILQVSTNRTRLWKFTSIQRLCWTCMYPSMHDIVKSSVCFNKSVAVDLHRKVRSIHWACIYTSSL